MENINLNLIIELLEGIKRHVSFDENLKVEKMIEIGFLSEEQIIAFESLGYTILKEQSSWDDYYSFFKISWKNLDKPYHELLSFDGSNYTVHYLFNPRKKCIEDGNHALLTFKNKSKEEVLRISLKEIDEDNLNVNSVFQIDELVNFSEEEIKEMIIEKIKTLSASGLHDLIEKSPSLLSCFYSILNPDNTLSLVDCRLERETFKTIYSKDLT
jgi:hypothetical protein